MALTKVSGGILDPGINVAGIVTATGFDGPFIGGSSKNIIAGIITATELDISGNIDVDGHTELDQLNVSGVSTFVGNIGGTPTFTGDVTFNGNVSIAQTLTYSDVTNIDSVGIVTAREGVFLPDNKKLELGNVAGSGDLQLYHNASNSILKNNTGDLELRSNVLKILGTTGAEASVFTRTGSVDLMFNGVKKFETTNTGVTISGANATGTAIKGSLSLQNEGGTQNIVHLPATGKLRFADNKKATFGNSDDLEIYHSTHNIIQSNGLLLISSDNTNNVKIMTKNMSQNSARFIPDGASELYHNGSKKFETNSIGVDITGTTTDDGARHDGDVYFIGATSGRNAVWDMSDNALEFADSTVASFGDSADLRIYHNGSDSVLQDQGTGSLLAITNTFHIKNAANNETLAKFIEDGAVELYHNNQKKIETFATGANVIGNLDVINGHVYINDSYKAYFGTGNDLFLEHDGNNSVFRNTTGDFYIQNNGSGTMFIQPVNNVGSITAVANGRVELAFAGNKKFETTSSGVEITGDIGSASAEIGNVFLADSKKVFLGSDQDTSIHHDGTHAYLTNTTGNLFVTNSGYTYIDQNYFRVRNAAGNHMLECNLGGANAGTRLLHTGASLKLATSSTGITVTGEVAASQDYPNFRPTLDLNFAAEKKLDTKITYERTGPASFTNEFAKVVLVGGNVPRFDHDPVTRESKGLLIEESRTNSLTYSQPTSAASFASNGTFTYNAATAPNGKTEAFRIANNPAASSSSYHRATRAINFSADAMVLSVWAKGDGGNNYFVWSFQNLGGAIVRAGFKLEGDGETSIVTNGNGGHTLQIEKYPDGWYRCIIIGNTDSSGSTTQFLYSASGYSESSSATGGSTLLWGFQLEVGSFATSYIPTSSAAVTRGADQTYIDGDDFLDFYNQLEGTVISSHSILPNIPSDNNLYTYQIAPTGATAYAPLRILDKNSSIANSIAVASVYNNGYTFLTTDTGNPVTVAGRKYVIAVSIKKDDYDAVFDGGDLLSDGSGDLYTADHISIGYYKPSPQAYLNGHIQRLIYYPTKLTNNQLKTITS